MKNWLNEPQRCILLKPHVTEVLVCNPRKIPLLKQGNQSDEIDARKLAERLRLHDLKRVYHGETGIRMLRELARSYLTVVKDLSRVMNRLKALYRSWAIPCAGRDVYYSTTRGRAPSISGDFSSGKDFVANDALRVLSGGQEGTVVFQLKRPQACDSTFHLSPCFANVKVRIPGLLPLWPPFTGLFAKDWDR